MSLGAFILKNIFLVNSQEFFEESCRCDCGVKKKFEQEANKMVWGFVPGSQGPFCQLRFWVVSGAKATLVSSHTGGAGCDPRWCVAAPFHSAPGDMDVCKCAPDSGPQSYE